jgi:anti-sigma regulatory factor (Ser/Thr protein kinase)
MRELSLHILDILQNSVEAGATRVELTIDEDLAADRLTITIEDNGRGIPPEKLPALFDPFYTTRSTRHVGLGLPLLKAAAERCNGDVTVASEVGAGTTLTAAFQHSHLDRAPLGDLTGTLLTFVLGGACDLRYVHRVREAEVDKQRRSRGGEEGTAAEWESGRRGGAGEDRDLREFGFDTAEIKAELGEVPLTHPDVREWLRMFIAEGEADLG